MPGSARGLGRGPPRRAAWRADSLRVTKVRAAPALGHPDRPRLVHGGRGLRADDERLSPGPGRVPEPRRLPKDRRSTRGMAVSEDRTRPGPRAWLRRSYEATSRRRAHAGE